MNEAIANGCEVLLVGNYPPDGQESMARFARMLATGLRAQGVPVDTVTPQAWFGRLWPGSGGIGKWLGYLDKYLVFPWRLRRRVRHLRGGGIVHIADHSNAMYTRAARSAGHRVVVTCHDLGAVRGALGEDTDCPASRLGKVLQRWIARSLGEADALPCVSEATRRDVERLIRRSDGTAVDAPVILNGFNVPYAPVAADVARRRLGELPAAHPVADEAFVLNVGSSLSRKNRAGVLRIFAAAQERWPMGWLVFAGEALIEPELALARELRIAERVVQVVKPPDALLEALYNRAVCLLFPSKFEGFGWPVIEAQVCGCPVLCSGAGALGEVAGEGAFVRDWRDEVAFTEELVRLAHDDVARTRWARLGKINAERFRTENMVARYRDLYASINQAETTAMHQEAVFR